MVATAGKGPPGRTPRASEPQNRAADPQEHLMHQLANLDERHRRRILRNKADLDRYLELVQHNAEESHHRDDARENGESGGCARTDVGVDRVRSGGGAANTDRAREGEYRVRRDCASSDRITLVADAKQPAAVKPQKKRAAKYRAKLTTPDMEFMGSKGVRRHLNLLESRQDSEAKGADEVGIESMDISDEAMETPSHTSQRTEVLVSRLQDETQTSTRNVNAIDAVAGIQGQSNVDGENGNGRPFVTPACTVSGDPNLMAADAEQCTGLNSDEDSSLEEECEDDDGGSVWSEDWDLGELTDEEEVGDHEATALPDSLYLSAACNKKTMKDMRKTGWEYDPDKFSSDPTYTDLYDGPFGPSDSVMSVAEDPLALLFYFIPPRVWSQIALESNRYQTQTIVSRARSIRDQQRRSGGEVEDLSAIRRRLASVPDIQPWEILRVMALLIARMLNPIRKGIAAHWSLRKVGALPSNRFGQFMSKNRFFHIMGHLHFSNNRSPQTKLDRAWKIRPIVEVLQRTFARGYRTPPVISFDEATLPSRSRYNPTRQYNKDKPHKWGTKVFVAACAKTAYCMRLEVYCGAKTHLQTPVPKDNNCGEAAVIRNMNALCPPSSKSPWRLVVTDRFYTSVTLALELLHRRMYLTGTIQTDRSGYAEGVITSKKIRQVNGRKEVVPSQGTLKIAENKMFPSITALMWMDRNPVHMLSSGGSRVIGTVMRRVRGVMTPVPAPELVRDYHRWMGGVDVNDQLRMQRYSVQLSYKTRKYYKTLFLGLFDMALVNAFIVFRHHRKINNLSAAKHFKFFETLMEQLLAVDSTETFDTIAQATRAEDRTAASPVRPAADRQTVADAVTASGHTLEENPDKVDRESGRKRRHRSCKVCALFKVKPRKYTKYFCLECSTGNRRKYLCNVAREGQDKTCFHIWHTDWRNGNSIPQYLLKDHKVRDRPPSQHPGKKRRRRNLEAESGVEGTRDETTND